MAMAVGVGSMGPGFVGVIQDLKSVQQINLCTLCRRLRTASYLINQPIAYY